MLEQQYAALFDEVGTLSSELKTKTEDLSKAVAAERSAREQEDDRIRDQLKKAVAEGIPLSAIGAICFLLGIAAGTASPEIAMMFGAGACQ